MNYWVCRAGRYRSTSILERTHEAFINCVQFDAMIYMPDEIIIVRIMTVLDMEFEKAMHCHDERYESDNDHGLPPWVMRPNQVYSVFRNETSFDLANFAITQCPISPFAPHYPRTLPY